MKHSTPPYLEILLPFPALRREERFVDVRLDGLIHEGGRANTGGGARV